MSGTGTIPPGAFARLGDGLLADRLLALTRREGWFSDLLPSGQILIETRPASARHRLRFLLYPRGGFAFLVHPLVTIEPVERKRFLRPLALLGARSAGSKVLVTPSAVVLRRDWLPRADPETPLTAHELRAFIDQMAAERDLLEDLVWSLRDGRPVEALPERGQWPRLASLVRALGYDLAAVARGLEPTGRHVVAAGEALYIALDPRVPLEQRVQVTVDSEVRARFRVPAREQLLDEQLADRLLDMSDDRVLVRFGVDGSELVVEAGLPLVDVEPRSDQLVALVDGVGLAASMDLPRLLHDGAGSAS